MRFIVLVLAVLIALPAFAQKDDQTKEVKKQTDTAAVKQEKKDPAAILADLDQAIGSLEKAPNLPKETERLLREIVLEKVGLLAKFEGLSGVLQNLATSFSKLLKPIDKIESEVQWCVLAQLDVEIAGLKVKLEFVKNDEAKKSYEEAIAALEKRQDEIGGRLAKLQALQEGVMRARSAVYDQLDIIRSWDETFQFLTADGRKAIEEKVKVFPERMPAIIRALTEPPKPEKVEKSGT